MNTLSLQYLTANAAWMVMWHDQRLAGPMSASDARAWMRDHGIDPTEVTMPAWLANKWKV